MSRQSNDVVLVEDDAPMRVANRQTLELAGMSVESFETAEEALLHMRRDHAGVVVTDVRLPGRDGLTLLRDIMAFDPSAPVILVTAHGDVPLAVEAMRDGAFDFIEKPFAPQRLVDVVQRALSARRSGGQLAWAQLTQREHEVTQWVGAGKTNAEIAEITGISEGTVKRHLTHVFEKLGLSSRAQLVRHLTERQMGRRHRGGDD